MHQFSFEKLEVWQLARKLTVEVYRISQSFPPDEKFLLTSQLRRAAVSVGSNISEGTTRSSIKDQAHFTTIAYGSLMELFNHLVIANDLNYITDNDVTNFRIQIKNLSVKLSNLRTAQLKQAIK